MRKADIIARIAEKTGIPKVDVMVTLETFFKEVKDSLSEGEEVFIRGFGSFITKYRAHKVGRHIFQNKTVEIPEHLVPSFRPAKSFVESVKERSAINLAKGTIKLKTKNIAAEEDADDDE